jgi:hypothetical protein
MKTYTNLKPGRVVCLEQPTRMESSTETPTKPSNQCQHAPCKHPAKLNNHCIKHQRYFQLKDATEKGITLCRFFLRGCNNQIEAGKKTCDDCLAKKHEGKSPCGHEGCKAHASEGKYCKLHLRDVYRDEEKEKGIRYCNITRGCFNVLTGTYRSCDECRAASREKEKELFEKRKEIQTSLKTLTTTSQRICVDCGKEFEMFLTVHGKESRRCSHCNQTIRRQDEKRYDRERDFKKEYLTHYKTYYKSYYVNAHKRGYDFTLTEEFFLKTISSPCHYCNHFKDGEAVGIDRINNSIGYLPENCVPCCEVCNRMKSFYHPAFFVEKAKHIARETTPPSSFYKHWDIYYSRSCYHCFSAYKKEATEKRKMSFDLSYDQWDTLIRSPCYLCGYASIKGIGIDRVDNTIRAYSIDNCRPCCGSCNSMKHDLSPTLFVSKCKEIDAKWTDMAPLLSVPMFENPLKPTYASIPTAAPASTASTAMATAAADSFPDDPEKLQARTLYRFIKMGRTEPFLEYNKSVLTKAEFQAFLDASSKALAAEETALPILQKYLKAMRQRRLREKKRLAAA